MAKTTNDRSKALADAGVSNTLNNTGDGIIQGDIVIITKTGFLGKVTKWHHDAWYTVDTGYLDGAPNLHLLCHDHGEFTRVPNN